MTASALNIAVNGDFEQPVLTAATDPVGWRYYGSGSSFPGWTVGGHSIEIVSDGYGLPPAWGFEFWIPASGHQSVDLNGLGPGTISQDVSTVPGQTYYLSFAMAGNDIGGSIVVTMDFFWHDHVVDTLSFTTNTPEHNSGYNMGWTYYEYAVTSPTALTRLTFESLSPNAGSRGPALDDVVVGDVPRLGDPFPPDPVPDVGATMALLLMGLAGTLAVSGTIRRRSSAA